ncbi:MAG TPA: SDR family NAD(P)-dependent oxidoreductase [Solirubrobacterales bacterium]|nr:SDR family NAD(P)-dependent oxidoreductase [Solirubrobacterales bacterium]
MSNSHEGRTALVTGAAAGIGQAYAKRLAEDGANVVVADISDGAETVGLIEAAGSQGLAVECDVSSAEAVAAAAAAAQERFGTVDILVHNAGIYPIQDFASMSFEDWRQVLSVNLDSAFHLCHELLPGMREQEWGRVVLIASNTFHAGIGNMAHYVASKGGLIGFLRSLADEVGNEGVTVNGVAPSLVRSKGTIEGPHEELGLFEFVAQGQAIKRTQEPEDLVGAISFLTSDDAAFITGQTLCVDGGWVRA